MQKTRTTTIEQLGISGQQKETEDTSKVPESSSPPPPDAKAAAAAAAAASWSRLDQVLAYVHNHLVLILFIVVYAAANAVLFFIRIWQLRQANLFYMLAKASGYCLNLNCSLVLVLMLRKCITWLRCHGATTCLPLDSHVFLHKLIGWITFFLSLGHTAMHLANLGVGDVLSVSGYVEYVFGGSGRPAAAANAGGWVAGTANVTGATLLVILLVMVAFSQPCVRRNGCFEVFYWTHLLYVAFWCVLILHASNFWIWFLAPGLIYLVELAARIRRRNIGRTVIVDGITLPSGVTQLIIKRPPKFRFRPGDYILVNIPSISKHEWHPFTISSAPEQKGLMSVHVRAVGEWTTGVYEYFAARNSPSPLPLEPAFVVDDVKWRFVSFNNNNNNDNDSMPTTAVGRVRSPFAFFRNQRKYSVEAVEEKAEIRIDIKGKGPQVEVYLDGPYGTPTSSVFSARRAVLVAAGIGITPYASVLQSVLLRYWATHRASSACTACTCPLAATDLAALPGPVRLTQVHFIWINRDLTSLEWFFELLSHLKGELNRRCCPVLNQFLTIDLYVTRKKNLELSSFPREWKGSIHLGRPKWQQVLSSVAAEGPRSKVTLFCCGPRNLKKELRKHCIQLGFMFRKEAF